MFGHVPGSPDGPAAQRGITFQTFCKLPENPGVAVGATFLSTDVVDSCKEDLGVTGAYHSRACRERSHEGAHLRKKR